MKLARSLTLAALLACIGTAHAGAIHDDNLFTNILPANDDGSTGLVPIGFNINFYGVNHSDLFVNNNGNVTFNAPLSTYTPFGLTTSSIPIIAPYFADWDSRGPGSGVTRYGQGNIGGRQVFGVNWINIGYYPSAVNRTNSAQLILTDRSDTGAGNFDIQFNYDRIQFEAGSASGGSGGLGGTSAAVGYTDGGVHDYEFAGSRVNGAFLDTNLSTGLIHGALNSSVLGQYNFSVRNGTVLPVPEPENLVLMSLAGLMMVSRLRKGRSFKKAVQATA